MGLLIGPTTGALGFLTALSPGLGSSGASGSVGENFAQATNSNNAGLTNPLATALSPLTTGQARNAPLPNALAPDTLNALFAAQSQSGPPANSDGASDIASLQSELTAFSTAQAGEADTGGASAPSFVDSSQGTTAPPSASANNFLDQLMQHQALALGSLTGHAVSVSA